jgi:LPXTG-site transpeptidase (sortase) family protein
LLAHIAPTRVSIPRLGVSESLIRLGLNKDRTMQVPQDPAKPGWYTGAPVPGELGPAVIAGHVTWDGAPAVFFKVGSLKAGDTVEVDRKDGSTAVFAVTRTEEFRKDAFPTEEVYGFIDHAGLRLITCGGTYDAKARRYLSNVIVFGELVSVRHT